jgi:hypothetical protein
MQKALFHFLTVTKSEGTFVRNVTMEHEIDGSEDSGLLFRVGSRVRRLVRRQRMERAMC